MFSTKPLIRAPSLCRLFGGCPRDNLKADPSLSIAENIVKPFDEIPGPRPIPVLGNIWRYMPIIGQYSFKYIHRTYAKMNLEYGPLVRENVFGSRELVHAFSPEDIQTVYETNFDYPTRQTHQALIKYRMERPHKFKTIGVFLSNGPEWLNMREKFSPMMLRDGIQTDYTKIMEEVSQDFVDLIPRILDPKGEVDLEIWLNRWALETFAGIALDRRLGCFTEGGAQVEGFVKAAADTHRCVHITEISPFYKYFRTPAYRKLERAQNFVAEFVSQQIQLEKLGPNALLRKMLNIEGVNFDEVFVMSQDMFLAGIDTMSYTTAFAFYNLAKNQRAQDKLRAMLMKESPAKDSIISEKIEDESMAYLEGVVSETLRLNPVAFGNGRILSEDLVLSGYRVPMGTNVILQHQLACLNKDYFPHPEVFLPERWVDKWDQPMYHPVAYAPFGFGSRTCLGRRIAMRQTSLILAKMVRNFKISYHHEDIDCECRLVSVPDRPLRLKFTPVEQ